MFCVFSINLSAQINAPEIATGILYADIKTRDEVWKRGRAWRRGSWISLHSTHQFSKKWLCLDVGMTYQERNPLEVFSFGLGDSSMQVSGVTSRFSLVEYPTSPQNELFNTDEYIRFPNFKYLNMELIPNITLGKPVSFTIGIGLFGGILLNKKQTTFTKEDFPKVIELFSSPRNVNGEIRYHKYDYGWMPKIVIRYSISNNIKLGLHLKSYQSLSRLNDTFVNTKTMAFNMRWQAFAGGLSLQYSFKKLK